ncbi:MAG: hypothetical protein B6I37_09290 [Desulfobacteraceae bacterium 4572_35.2]|nr:MAG: hypothetical protein B6I37_09290 [Desulfobacteraceae bacterium 4572_35.2]
MAQENTTGQQDQGLEADLGEALSMHRKLSAFPARLVYVVAIIMSLVHLWFNAFGVMPEIQRNFAVLVSSAYCIGCILLQTVSSVVSLLPSFFWYSQDANVTPPLCLAAYSAASIASSQPLKTGMEAWKLAKVVYLIPLLFIYTSILFFELKHTEDFL